MPTSQGSIGKLSSERELHEQVAQKESHKAQTRGIVGWFYNTYIKTTRAFLAQHPGASVLDIGCGRGRHSLYLAEMGFRVTATDLSPEGIVQLNERARQKNLERNITTLVSDMLDLSFDQGQFDCVLAFNSIYHTDYSGLKSTIAKITEFLRDSGGLYITFNSKSSQSYRDPVNKRIDEYTIIKTQGVEKGIPHTHLDYEDIIVLLSAYNIKKIQHIQDFYNRGDSFHYFVEAEKK